MGKSLVLVESPAKAKTINRILGKDFSVQACMGHVRDLPEKKLGIDLKNGFTPEYVTIKRSQKLIKELIEKADKADAVYLAPDPDREGEAIAWHLQELLSAKVAPEKFHRVSFNEITPSAVRESFAHPTVVDRPRVDAQQARRVLDRLVGYKVSPLLWSRVKRGSSAGRVQSVALRVVCEREQEILNFVPEEYWVFGANVRKQVAPLDPFEIKLVRVNDEKLDVKSEEQAKVVLSDLQDNGLKVTKIATRDVHKRPSPPFITSTLQQAANSACSFSPARTMQIAQKLYEGMDVDGETVGLITYMRTDSVNVSKDAQEATRGYIQATYGEKFVPEKPNVYKSRGSAQEAHEAVRPTDVNRTPDSLANKLAPEELRLYRLIWNRFVASQMSAALIHQLTVDIVPQPPAGKESVNTYLFHASASNVVFPGYMKVAGSDKKDPDEAPSLPPLAEGEGLECLEWLHERKETQPPKRYSEAALIRVMEDNGVGRPSTYAQILQTLDARKYVTKEKRILHPTELGVSVNAFLVGNLNDLFEVGFTAGMEEALDKVENGDLDWVEMLNEFYGRFTEWLAKAKGPPADVDKVRHVLSALDRVQEWGPETKRGKRVYSDNKFFESIRKQLDDGKKPISQRQLESLVTMASRYKDQLPGVEDEIKGLGLGAILETPEAQPPLETTMRKLDLLQTVEFQEPTEHRGRTYDDAAFTASLRERAVGGRRLTVAQLKALDRLFTKYADQIPDFENIREELGFDETVGEEDVESGPLLELGGHIKEWADPVKRGRRTFDDNDFFKSLSDQFARKKTLTPRQKAALKRMLRKYEEQIPDFEAAAAKYGIAEKKKKKAAAEPAEEAKTEGEGE